MIGGQSCVKCHVRLLSETRGRHGCFNEEMTLSLNEAKLDNLADPFWKSYGTDVLPEQLALVLEGAERARALAVIRERLASRPCV